MPFGGGPQALEWRVGRDGRAESVPHCGVNGDRGPGRLKVHHSRPAIIVGAPCDRAAVDRGRHFEDDLSGQLTRRVESPASIRSIAIFPSTSVPENSS